MLVPEFKYSLKNSNSSLLLVLLPAFELSTYNAFKSFEMFYGSYFAGERDDDDHI